MDYSNYSLESRLTFLVVVVGGGAVEREPGTHCLLTHHNSQKSWELFIYLSINVNLDITKKFN